MRHAEQWDRRTCQEIVCTCHDDTIAAPYFCGMCGCQPSHVYMRELRRRRTMTFAERYGARDASR